MINLFLESLTPQDFKKGEVYRMAVASRSHVKKPYYVLIKDVGDDYIETYIPNRNSNKINFHSAEWDYHIPRMTLINADKSIVYNQVIE